MSGRGGVRAARATPELNGEGSVTAPRRSGTDHRRARVRRGMATLTPRSGIPRRPRDQPHPCASSMDRPLKNGREHPFDAGRYERLRGWAGHRPGVAVVESPVPPMWGRPVIGIRRTDLMVYGGLRYGSQGVRSKGATPMYPRQCRSPIRGQASRRDIRGRALVAVYRSRGSRKCRTPPRGPTPPCSEGPRRILLDLACRC